MGVHGTKRMARESMGEKLDNCDAGIRQHMIILV